jgi:hypothetical protein
MRNSEKSQDGGTLWQQHPSLCPYLPASASSTPFRILFIPHLVTSKEGMKWQQSYYGFLQSPTFHPFLGRHRPKHPEKDMVCSQHPRWASLPHTQLSRQHLLKDHHWHGRQNLYAIVELGAHQAAAAPRSKAAETWEGSLASLRTSWHCLALICSSNLVAIQLQK